MLKTYEFYKEFNLNLNSVLKEINQEDTVSDQREFGGTTTDIHVEHAR